MINTIFKKIILFIKKIKTMMNNYYKMIKFKNKYKIKFKI
jgi:hypothetical protein